MLDTLDPLSRRFERLHAKQPYFARRYEESRAAYVRILDDDPSRKRGYEDLAFVYVAMGRPRDAAKFRVLGEPQFDFLRDVPRFRAWEARLARAPRPPYAEHTNGPP